MAKRSNSSTIERPSLKLLWRDTGGFTVSYGIVAGLIGIAAVASIGAFKKKSGKAIRDHAKGTFNSLFNKGHKTGTTLALEIEKEVGIDLAELALGAGVAAAPNIIIASIRKRHRAPDEASEPHDLQGDHTPFSDLSSEEPFTPLHVNDHRDEQPPHVYENNCGYCTITALQDERNLTRWFNIWSDPFTYYDYLEHPRLNEHELDDEMKRSGLITEQTTPARGFSKPVDPKNGAEAGEKFMKDAAEDTFAVAYERQDPVTGKFESHTVTAIRQEDGSILYIDFHQNPPHVSNKLADGNALYYVAPVAVEWHENSQLNAAAERGTRVDELK